MQALRVKAEGFDQLAKLFGQMAQSQVPFACALGLTRTAQQIKADIEAEMPRVLDRPTPYTMRGWRLRPATKQRLQASVEFRDAFGDGTPAHDYLGPEVFGGQRRAKGIEVALRAIGALPAGWFAVPGQGARIDAYGNMSRGQIIQILSQLRITLTAGYSRNMSFDRRKMLAAQKRAGGRYYVVKPGEGKNPGVYQRELLGRNTTPVLVFVRGVTYAPRLDVKRIAEDTLQRVYEPTMLAAMQQAMATARPGVA